MIPSALFTCLDLLWCAPLPLHSIGWLNFSPDQPGIHFWDPPCFEEVAGQRGLPLGGVNGDLGVRGKQQGRAKDKFQGGVTPKKQHRTALFATPIEAAIAFAQLKEDLEVGMLKQRSSKKRLFAC